MYQFHKISEATGVTAPMASGNRTQISLSGETDAGSIPRFLLYTT